MPWWPFSRSEEPELDAPDAAARPDATARAAQRLLRAGLLGDAASLLLDAGRAREALELYLGHGDAEAALGPAEELARAGAAERLELGRELLRRGHARQAEALLRPLPGSAPAALLAEAHVALAGALEALGSGEAARVELELALAHDVTNAAAWHRLGQLRSSLEETASGTLRLPGERFGLQRFLGRGGSGRVYLASDRLRSAPVALKLFDARPGGREGLESLLHGVRLVAALPPHPHVLGILDVVPELGLVTTPFLPGGSLRALVGSRPPPQRWRDLLVQAARGLLHLHRHGVLHLDVKPANLLLDRGGSLVLSDFSLCRSGPPWPGLGSPDYAAPEVLLGEPPGPASDTYSLALVAYELAAGARPFPAGTPVRTEAFRPLTELRPDLPPAAASLVERALRLEPHERASLQELHDALARA